MKKIKLHSRIVILAILMTVFITELYVYFGPGFKLELVKSFTIPELKGRNPNFIKFKDAVLTTSDSVIYIVDAKDKTNLKSYAYSFSGKRDISFKLPADSQYVEPQLFSYLKSRNQLVINNLEKGSLDFYTTAGEPVKSNNCPYNNSAFTNIAEYKGKMFYTIYNSGINGRNSSIRLFEEMNNNLLRLIKELIESKGFNNAYAIRCNIIDRLQIDSNGLSNIARLKVEKLRYTVTTLKDDKENKFLIKRHKYFLPGQMGDFPAQFFAGDKFIVLGIFGKDIRPLTERIYSYKGKYLGKLPYKKMQDSELVDVSNDLLICFNAKTSSIYIYKLRIQ